MASSWWSVSKITEKTQQAIKHAQKRIDHVLDIHEEGAGIAQSRPPGVLDDPVDPLSLPGVPRQNVILILLLIISYYS